MGGERCSFMWIKFGRGMTGGKRTKQLKCVKSRGGGNEYMLRTIIILCIIFQT